MRIPGDLSDGDTPLIRSVTACLAAILERPAADLRIPEGHPEPWTAWRNRLGQFGLGLVPVGDPASFQWPGPWLALFERGDVELCGIAFGVPPGMIWQPLGEPAAFNEVRRGFVVAPADIALWTPATPAAPVGNGRVEAVMLARSAGSAMASAPSALAVAGRGLEGDRYFDGEGTFSNPHAQGTDLTLVEAEALEAVEVPGGALTAADARRNVVTRGVALNALVGRRFAIGPVECIGRRLCEPCAHLQELTRPGVLRELVHRGGLRADIVTGGTISVGDDVRPTG
jgi:MOSC domain-containing protein YiiM